MTDIVERLREEVEVFYGKPPCSLLNEAADKIERLREALSDMTEIFKATEASAQWALSEAERLRKALQSICDCSTKMDYRKTSKRLDETYRIARKALGEKE